MSLLVAGVVKKCPPGECPRTLRKTFKLAVMTKALVLTLQADRNSPSAELIILVSVMMSLGDLGRINIPVLGPLRPNRSSLAVPNLPRMRYEFR